MPRGVNPWDKELRRRSGSELEGLISLGKES